MPRVCLREARRTIDEILSYRAIYRRADHLRDWTGGFPPWKMSINAFFGRALD
jgi:hypothetical protein